MTTMDRRDLLRLGAFTLGAAPFAAKAVAQTPAAPAPAAFYLDAYSRNLQWRRTPQDLAKAVTDLGLHSVDLTIAPYPGHIDPAQVRTQLPAFVKALAAYGVEVRTVTTQITSADGSDVEPILGAIAQAGIGSYTWGPVPYDEGRPYAAEMSALKARFAKLARLNEKHRLKGLYHPAFGSAGDLFVDLLPVLQGLDPRHTAVRYDTAVLLQTRPENVVRHLKMGAPYIGAIAIKDAALDLEFPKWEQGRFVGSPELLTLPNGGGDNTGEAGGDWFAYGGGGRPLPYHFHPKPVGTGMIDLLLLGKTLKEINFSGPAECQVEYPLGGAETGADKITLPTQEVIGRMKRDRITVEQAFAGPWGLKVALPPFMQRSGEGAAGPAAAAPPSAAKPARH